MLAVAATYQAEVDIRPPGGPLFDFCPRVIASF